MKDIEKTIDECKKELNKYFYNHPFIIWKEEDLQSYLFHLLLKKKPSLFTRTHREYPIVIQKQPRDWRGMLDIAIVEEFEQDFNLKDVKIVFAIELKFMRDYRTGKSPKGLKGFEKECSDRGDL